MARERDDDATYMYQVDSEIFIGAHIFPLQYYKLVRRSSFVCSGISQSAQWDSKGYSGIVTDPYSVPGASKSKTSRKNTDTRRMNSIDNGLLLCVRHHIEFDAFLFSIKPEVRIHVPFFVCAFKSPYLLDPCCDLVSSAHHVY